MTFAPDSGQSISISQSLELEAGLARFGFQEFRPGQREAVEILLEKKKLLLVAPTGGGKSLTYQLPASLLPGTTVVISPLIALMHDQVQALEEKGIAATFLASTLSSEQARERMRNMAQGAYKLVYVAPERLNFPGFRSLVQKLDCPLIAIDEAHCISEWGHDFRPEYMRIGEFISEMPHAAILACTATATPFVRDEILARLGLGSDTPQLIKGFARPNLALRAMDTTGKKDRNKQVDRLLRQALRDPGSDEGTAIIYAPTRKATEQEALRLAESGWRAAPYHAGLGPRVREDTGRAFKSGELQLVVATNAFGMGIDRGDVRAVIHLAPPGSMEAYYQEVGRAGRDGEDAFGLLLTSASDMPLRRHLLERGSDGEVPPQQVVEHKWNLFLELMRWAEGGSCRHDAILRYFGDHAESLDGCGRCDVCLSLEQQPDQDSDEVTLYVRKALSGVARVHGRFGLRAAAQLLSGKKEKRLISSGLSETKTFGILSQHSEEWNMKLLRRCVTAGWVSFIGGDRPLAVLTEDGISVMKGERPGHLLLPPLASHGHIHRSETPEERKDRRSERLSAGTLQGDAIDLFEALREYRLEQAKSQGVPPYVVASDRTLRDLAMLKPRNMDELKLAHGIGPAKAERYGSGFLSVIQRFLSN
ncbi:MAG: ATP-dependent DNA helicase RecQ [Deltaproteobacteria bacterium]|nr:ATP-dependent DNA helicase RecQ [Deltaproteobacteria bacterium]